MFSFRALKQTAPVIRPWIAEAVCFKRKKFHFFHVYAAWLKTKVILSLHV